MDADTTYLDLGGPILEACKKFVDPSVNAAAESLGTEMKIESGGVVLSQGSIALEPVTITLPDFQVSEFESTIESRILGLTKKLRRAILSEASSGIAELAALYSRSEETDFLDIESMVKSLKRDSSSDSVEISPDLMTDSKQQFDESFIVSSGFELIWLEAMREEGDG